MASASLCGAVRKAMLTGSPHLRYWQNVRKCFILKPTRWCMSSGGQQHYSLTLKGHQTPVVVVNNKQNIKNLASLRIYSTSSDSGPPWNSNETEKDEVDFEAVLELEVELDRQQGFLVPSKFTPSQWKKQLDLPTLSSRRKFREFLFKTEMKTLNKKKKQELKRVEREEKERERKERPSPTHIQYSLWDNSIFPKILPQRITRFQNTRVVQAILYGQPLVIDMDFDKHMTSREQQNCAFQIQVLLGENRRHRHPYAIELHNAPSSLDTMTRLHRYIPTMYTPKFPLVINENSYLEKYPKEQLVYLTPHCEEELSLYDHNAVYIIGAIVDKGAAPPLTLAKAKREGIRMQKLPLNRYLTWDKGHKRLPLNIMIKIMLDIKESGDWSYAFRHIPRRKIQSGRPITAETVLQSLERKGRK